MGAALGKLVNEEWSQMPWRAVRDPREQAKVLPTFVACESIFGVLAAAALAHAKRTNDVQLWFYGWMCGTANDALFMLLPFVDNFWHAQGTVMLTPRLPLYIPAVYAVFTYTGIAAARRFGLPYAQEAALAGLLSHLLYHPYDINGPRFLWWTWHDGDPSVSARQENAPIGSSAWVLTYIPVHALLSRWVNDGDASFVGALRDISDQLPGALAGKVRVLARVLDQVHAVILKSPGIAKIAFCGVAGTPLFMWLMGIFQIASLDKIGVPGVRTYRLIILSYLCAVVGPSLAKHGQLFPSVPSAKRAASDGPLFKVLAAYFAIQLAIGCLGNPETHVSTGCHQICSDGDEKGVDIMGWERNEYMRSSGPFEHSRFDYKVLPSNLEGQIDGAGRTMIAPRADKGSSAREWYTVLGIKHKDRARELGRLAFYCACGVWAYRRALASSA